MHIMLHILRIPKKSEDIQQVSIRFGCAGGLRVFEKDRFEVPERCTPFRRKRFAMGGVL